jgi:pyrimidine operon attenuation protein/uracil phosphoribosyltransferase
MGSSRQPRDAELAADLVVVGELLDATAIARALRRIASEIVERSAGVEDVVLVGIRTGGVPLAERIAAAIAEVEGKRPPLGAIDITLYRDDVFVGLPKPEVGPTDLPLPIAGRKLVLVDDVLFTGRTVRAALDVVMDYGRPRAVELAALIDRGHRELPIQPDYVGLAVATTRAQSVRVELVELGASADRAILRERRPPPAAAPSPRDDA